MTPRLKVKLYQGWKPVANPNGPATYMRGNDPDGSALQFSFAQYRPDTLLTTTQEHLIGICEKLTNKLSGRAIVSRSSGKCTFGFYGTVISKGHEPAHSQIWVVSNRREFILITHTCANEPGLDEMEEANQIALMTYCE